MSSITSRRVRLFLLSLAMLGAVLLLVVAAFPWGTLKGFVADRLSARFGTTVTIDRVERVDGFGFTPTIAVRGLRVPQPAWAGRGDLARLDRAQATFAVWPLLLGRFEPRDIRVDGLALMLVRTRDGRENWRRPGKPEGGNSATEIGALTVTDSVIDYRDAKRDRHVTAHFASDAVHGLRARGDGVVAGAKVTLAVTGAPVGRAGAWPFTATIDGPALAMTAKGTMDHALDTRAMTLDVTARARDLRLIDGVIEAGLFGTQPVRLRAHVRREAPRWIVTAMTGTIGKSDIAGHLTVDKRDGRTRLDGDIAARRFDFDDLSSDAGLAAGRALEARIGKRLVPDTRINLAKIDRTDGRIGFRIGRIYADGKPSSLRAGSGVLTMDHQLLTLSSLVMMLDPGRVTGSARVDQRGGRTRPVLTLDLSLVGGNLGRMLDGAGKITGGRVSGHARLTGTGDTVRAAVAQAEGRVGFVARDGELPRRYADTLGFDVGRVLLDNGRDAAGLRCLIVSLAMHHGRGDVTPMVLDTTQSRMRGTGVVRFPAETIDIRLTGAPKQDALLRLPGAAYVTGTLRAPTVTVPREVKSVGNIFKAIGRALSGDQGETATDADCAGLAARALR